MSKFSDYYSHSYVSTTDVKGLKKIEAEMQHTTFM